MLSEVDQDRERNTGLWSSRDVRAAPSPFYLLRGAESPVTALEFTEITCGALLSGCQNGQVLLWDLSRRRCRLSFSAHSGKPVLFLKSEDAVRKLMTQGRDGYFKVWKNTGSEYKLDGKLESGGDGFCPAVLLPQTQSTHLVALPGKDYAINVFDIANQSVVRRLAPNSNSGDLGLCMRMCTIQNHSGCASQLVVGYESGKVVLWDIGTGKIQHQTSAIHNDAVMCMTYSSAEFNKGLSGSVDEFLMAWKISDISQIEVISKIECTNAGFSDVKIRPDNRIAITAGWDNTLRIFNMKSLRPLAVLSYHKDSVLCVAFSENHLLAAGSKDQVISMWNIYRNV